MPLRPGGCSEYGLNEGGPLPRLAEQRGRVECHESTGKRGDRPTQLSNGRAERLRPAPSGAPGQS